MIIVSKQRYLPVTINTLTLSKEDTYFYVHRDVYDQAVILSDRYPTLDSLQTILGKSRISENTVSWFYDNAPKPLHTLAPYLSLVDGEIEQDMEICCGILHTITTMINVRNFITKPIEIRKSVSFSLSIKEEYEMSWDRFFTSAIPYHHRHELIDDLEANQTYAEMNPANLKMTSKLDGHSRKPEMEKPQEKSVSSSQAERTATLKLLN